MASQKHLIKLKSSESSHVYYKRKKKDPEKKDDKLKLKKYDPNVRKHVTYTEVKK